MYNKEQAVFYIQEFAYYEIDTNNCKNYFLSLPANVDYNKHVHVYKNLTIFHLIMEQLNLIKLLNFYSKMQFSL